MAKLQKEKSYHKQKEASHGRILAQFVATFQEAECTIKDDRMKINVTTEKIATGEVCQVFDITTRKGSASGLFSDRIYVHHIAGNGCVKGIMNTLCRRFETNKVTFTPLINNNLKNVVRGEIKICKAEDPNNPYSEDFEFLETEWEITN